MLRWKQKIPSQEVKVQKALGTLPQWEIQLHWRNDYFGDPKELPEIFDEYVEFWEPWSDGKYLCYATRKQLDAFMDAVRTIPDPEYVKRKKAGLSDTLPIKRYLSVMVSYIRFGD